MTADDSFGRLDDDDYPAYTMGRAAEMLGTTQGGNAAWTGRGPFRRSSPLLGVGRMWVDEPNCAP